MKTLWICTCLLGVPSLAAGQGADTLRLELDEAVNRAIAVSPLVRTAEGSVALARGERSEAVWPFPSNPAIEYERVRRRGLASEVTDFGWRFVQPIEVAGQAFVRAGAANRRISASEAGIEDAARSSGLTARYAYLNLYLAERRADLTAANAELAGQLAELARRQMDAGEISILAANTASLEAARANSEAMRLEAERLAAQSELRSALALGSDTVLATTALPPLPAIEPAVDPAVAHALERRPDLRAAGLNEDASRRTVTATRMRAIPNIELGVFNGREEGTDDLLGFSVGVSVPVFRRAQADVGAARAAHIAAQATSDAIRRAVRSDVVSEIARYDGAQRAMARLAQDLIAAAEENSELATRAFEEGELSVAEVVVFRSTALQAQLEYLDAIGAAYASWFALAAAIGVHPNELKDLLGGLR